MVHAPKYAISAGKRPLDMTADADTQADALERLAEVAGSASPQDRTRLEHTIDMIVRSRRTRAQTLKAIQQVSEQLSLTEPVTLMAELHIMDEERRSLAELHILERRSLE